MPTDTSFRQNIAALVAQHTPAVRAVVHRERTEACEAGKASVEQTVERERHRLRREAGELEGARDRALSTLETRAEEQRRACASTLLKEALDPTVANSLPSLIAKWRSEPSRQLTNAVRERWAELDARAIEQLGVPLGHHVLAAAFIDLIAASMPGALVYLSAPDYSNHKVIEALGRFARAQTPSATQAALEELEEQLMLVGQRGAGQPVEQMHLERHALRRANATHSDLSAARADFERDAERVRLEKFRAEYVPPPLTPPMPPPAPLTPPPLIDRVVDWLGST